MTPFEHPSEHLLAETTWVRAVVAGYLELTGRRLPAGGEPPRDLAARFAVTPDEAERLLKDPVQTPRPPGEAGVIRARVDGRVKASLAQGLDLPLAHLVTTFGLDELSRQLLVMALCGELDESIRRLYMYAWNDLSRRWPTLEFLLGLLQPSMFGKLLNAAAFFRDSPLVRHRLVDAGLDRDQDHPYLAREVRVAHSVTAWCIGGTELDPRLTLAAAVHEAPRGRSRKTPLVLPAEVRRPLARSLADLGRPGSPVVVIAGPQGVGKTALVRELVGSVVEVDVPAMVRPVAEAERKIAALERDARLFGRTLVADLADADQDDPMLAPIYRQLAQALDRAPRGAVVTARDHASWFVSLLAQAVVHTLGLPSKEERATLWQRALADAGALAADPSILDGATRYPLAGGSIGRAALAAVARARSDGDAPGGEGRAVRLADVTDACRAQLTPRLSGIAQRIVTTFRWDDLVLPEKELDLLREVVSFSRNRRKVFEEWGYGRLVPYGRGLSTLFAGPPGTGKTMAAAIIAGELGMEVFRVDLSRTVSKYIGETEKNLGRIFDEAAKSESVLLFDEADSLFAKRTSVQSSIDRYANLEVNYLLQRMEDYEGVTILTTNLEGSLDDAFKRRIRFRVSFPAPDEATRASLWRKMLPAEARCDESLDFDALGWDYELSGGHIKNAAVRAAFFAAERGAGMTNLDLRRAARLECEKLGKLVRAPDDLTEEGTP